MELIAKGTNGVLVVKENTIELQRSGWNAKLSGLRGNKEILIKNISSIQFKKPGLLTAGYIQFAFSGSSESKGGVFDAAKDENSIVFGKSETQNFEKLRDIINEKRNELNIHKQIHREPEDDIYLQIEKLSALKDKGIVSEEEFNAKKRQLLGI
ncbi:SHOCT domain-containing protein [Chryseobacterium sp.]|uniref:SHOCT domain-containing protein n=1 Tax=Chryseobacterium sp. TaxID=1871047 RepID=UPI002899F8DE|nr:SHOCT domain-containing protein [Chryseobacterium sp.]